MRIADRDGIWQGELRPIRAVIRQEINGEYSAEIELAERSDFFVRDAIVELPDANGTMQLFRLESPTTTLDTVAAFAWHISQDLAHDQIVNRGWESRTGAYVWPELITAGIEPARFSGTSDISTVNSLRIVRQSVLAAAIGERDNSFVNRFGGELRRDNYTVDCLTRIGRQTGYRIEYRKNLLGFEASADDSELVNRVIPTYLNAAEAAVQLPETYIDSPRISATAIPHSRAIYFSEIQVGREDDDGYVAYPTDADAQQAVRDAVQAMWDAGADMPAVTVKVSFLELRNTREYAEYRDLETLELGDSVDLLYEQWTVRERMIAYVWDALEKEYDEITLGSIERSISALTSDLMAQARTSAENVFADRFLPAIIAGQIALQQSAANAAGMYLTEIYDADGSRRIYWHDEPRLEDSQLIEYYPEPGARMYTQTGWNDGEPLWEYGQTSSGMLVMRLISTVGLSADWINLQSSTLSQYVQDVDATLELTLSSIIPEYYLSTSPDSLQGGSWSTSDPGEVTGKYVFTRSKIVRMDGSSFYSPVSDVQSKLTVQTSKITSIEAGQITLSSTVSGHGSRLTSIEAGQITLGNTVVTQGEQLGDHAEAISQTQAQIEVVDGALLTKVNQSDYDQDRLDMIDQITGKAEHSDLVALEDLQATMLQTQDQWAVVISEVQDVTGDHEVTVDQVRQYMNFGVDGLTIGDPSSSLRIRIDNERISFLDGSAEVAYITGQRLHITAATIVDSLQVGNHKIEKWGTGGQFTVFKYIGG